MTCQIAKPLRTASTDRLASALADDAPAEHFELSMPIRRAEGQEPMLVHSSARACSDQP